MEQIFGQFMHIYFWLFIVEFIPWVYNNSSRDFRKEKMHYDFWGVVAFSLFIMSFKY